MEERQFLSSQQRASILPVWRAMLNRCYKPTTSYFHIYGGRGIKVCERWRESFPHFAEDMGLRPTPKHSIDRIDVNGDYTPENCRWATPKEQARNQRKNVNVTINGETLCISAWCERYGVPVGRIFMRIQRGWSAERAITTPMNPPRGRRPIRDFCPKGHPQIPENLYDPNGARRCKRCANANYANRTPEQKERYRAGRRTSGK